MNDASLRFPIGSNKLLELVTGNITAETTDAIVNAANSSLMGGGGVDGAIHRAAGPGLLEECKKVVARQGSLPAGQAVATPGCNLRARFVIHTVGPVWYGGESREPETLGSAYRESLRVAEELKCSSVSFPSISTGAFGYPVHDAAGVAVGAVVEFLKKSESVRTVRFVLFDERSYKAYAKAASRLSPAEPSL